MIRTGQIVVLDVRDDPVIQGRRHESLAQYHGGIPVYGGSLARQTAQGATVSIIGTLFDSVSLDSGPTLGADEIAAAFRRISDGRFVGTDAPQRVIFPTLDGRFLLTYRATMSDAKTYFVDARSGAVVWTIDETVYQGQVGVGTGALGDRKKLSTTQASNMFRTHDQLRPAPVRTYDTRGSAATLNRLIGGIALDGDFAVDADNFWSDSPVVDAHVHTGWTQDYFFKQHSWTGVDNRRGQIATIVHSGLQNNAFFIGPPFGPGGAGAFVYGRSSSAPLTTLDIVAHELMHGVTHASLTQRTGSGLLSALFIDRFGPTSFTLQGSVFPCDNTFFVPAPGIQWPALCDGGRYILASNHPGAINEAFSDVFGIAAEFFHQTAGSGTLRADYKMGEDVTGLGAIRTPDNPRSLTLASSIGPIPFPDHASGIFSFLVVITVGTRANPVAVTLVPFFFVGNEIASLSSTDNGGVHWNSTALSHAFFLAIEGGRNETSGQVVQGVGASNRALIEKAFFRAMTVLMPNVPSMRTAAQAIYQAAVDLYGVSSPAAQSIRQAMLAAGFSVS